MAVCFHCKLRVRKNYDETSQLSSEKSDENLSARLGFAVMQILRANKFP